MIKMADQEIKENGVKASFDTTTSEGQIRVFNAQNGASISLKTLKDDDNIECNGAMQYDDQIDSYGSVQDGTISVLFGTDGLSYAGISDTVAKAVSKLIDLVNKTGMDSFTVKIVKQESNGGREFINLQLVG